MRRDLACTDVGVRELRGDGRLVEEHLDDVLAALSEQATAAASRPSPRTRLASA